MPTTRRYRQRHRRQQSADAITRWVRGEITDDQFCEAYGNRFARFSLTDTSYPLGQQVYEIWKREGKQLLKQAGYKGVNAYQEERINVDRLRTDPAPDGKLAERIRPTLGNLKGRIRWTA